MSQHHSSPDRRRWLQATAASGLSLTAPGLWAQAASPLPPARKLVQGKVGHAPRLAVVLGAGSARGFAHIGVIKALDAAGIRPDLIVGCSAGALVGAFWAAGVNGEKMEALAQQVRDEDVIDAVAGSSASRPGLVTGQALQNFVNEGLRNRPIETLPTPYLAVATKFPSGDLQVFRQGDLGFAVRASCSIPGVFMPPTQQGQSFLDGGLVSPMPVQTARAAGADLVVAVDLGGPDPGAANGSANMGLYKLLLRSFEIMGDSLRKQEAALADIVIRPDVARIGSTDFSARRTLVEAGFMAGQRLAPVILEKLRAKR